MRNNTNTPQGEDKQREYVATFVEFYADFLRCVNQGVYKHKEGCELLAENCHYLYRKILRENEPPQRRGLVNMDGTVEYFTGEY
jgi:hypothetical protein